MIRKSIILISGLFALLACLAGYLLVSTNEFFGDPIANQILASDAPWGAWVKLNKPPFSNLTTESNVKKSLERSHFLSTTNNALMIDEVLTARQHLYTREGLNAPCRVRLFVKLSFDDLDRLTAAEGMQQEAGCL